MWANLGRGTGAKARSLEGEGEKAEPEVRTPKQTERDWASFKEISDGAGEEVGLEAEGFFFLDFNP